MGPSDFSWALDCMRSGIRMRREGWNGQDMFCVLSPGASLTSEQFFAQPLKEYAKDKPAITVRPCFLLKTAQGDIAYWTPNTSDILATDWEEVYTD